MEMWRGSAGTIVWQQRGEGPRRRGFCLWNFCSLLGRAVMSWFSGGSQANRFTLWDSAELDLPPPCWTWWEWRQKAFTEEFKDSEAEMFLTPPAWTCVSVFLLLQFERAWSSSSALAYVWTLWLWSDELNQTERMVGHEEEEFCSEHRSHWRQLNIQFVDLNEKNLCFSAEQDEFSGIWWSCWLGT